MNRCLIATLTALLLLTTSDALPAVTDGNARREVVEATAAQMEAQYVSPELGRSVAVALRRRLAEGAYDGLTDADAFARRLTLDLRQFADDGHLMVEHSDTSLPDDANAANAGFDAKQRERFYGAHLNFGFRKIERIDGNIGLLTLDVFAPTSMGGYTAVAAMQLLAHTQALIVDLRRNGGGESDMVSLLAGYLFDEGGQPMSGLYWRPDNTTTQAHLPDYIPGPRYGQDKPVFVLISDRTFSAAEHFAYDLQALGRVTVVGETSGGGANPFEYSRLPGNFMLSLAKGRSVNPITGSNWQGVGVKPDVAVPANQALDKALELARERLGAAQHDIAPVGSTH